MAELQEGDAIDLSEVTDFVVININRIDDSMEVQFTYRGRTCRCWVPQSAFESVPKKH